MQNTGDQKQYYVVSEIRVNAFKILKPETIVLLSFSEAEPLLAANLVIPIYTAIKQGLYPPKQKESLVQQVIHEVEKQIHPEKSQQSQSTGSKTTTSSAVSEKVTRPIPQPSPIVEHLKESTKQYNAKSLAFENELRKKIQAKKKTSTT